MVFKIKISFHTNCLLIAQINKRVVIEKRLLYIMHDFASLRFVRNLKKFKIAFKIGVCAVLGPTSRWVEETGHDGKSHLNSSSKFIARDKNSSRLFTCHNK